MKEKIVYICEHCTSSYNTQKEALECEEACSSLEERRQKWCEDAKIISTVPEFFRKDIKQPDSFRSILHAAYNNFDFKLGYPSLIVVKSPTCSQSATYKLDESSIQKVMINKNE